MIEFGRTLREAREAKGYSASQLADLTHILPQIIESLEKEDFSRIVAPIYGRGFVKLYCEAVGIEPKPLVDEFMEIYNGNRPPVIRLKDAAPLTPRPEPEVENPSADAEPAADEPSLFVQRPSATEEAPATEAFPAADEPSPVATGRPPYEGLEPDLFTSAPEDAAVPEAAPRERHDYRLPGYSMPDVPRRFWRFGILIMAAAAVLALVFVSCRAIYRATMLPPEAVDTRTEEPAEAPAKAKPTADVPKTPTAATRPSRTPIRVPPLYID